MKQLLIILLTVVSLQTAIFAADQPILVSPQWVSEHLSDPDLVVLQVCQLRLDYEKEHITGARMLWPEWLAPNTPDGNFNVPDKKAATKVLQELGITKTSKIVLCHIRTDITITSRMFLTLEQLGFRGQVSFLNGGLEAWKKAGYAVTQAAAVFKKGNYKPVYGSVIVDKNYVLKTLKSDTSAVVDARMKIYYDGEPAGYPRDGHITGALNIPFPEMVDSTNAYKPLNQLEPYFKNTLLNKDKEVVLYCFIGQTASVVYMAGRLLGYNMKLYDGSLQEWTRREELPMEKTKP